MFHFNIFQLNRQSRQSPENRMKHHDNTSRKTILTFYLSLSILFTFILSVETNVNVTITITTTNSSTTDDKTPSSLLSQGTVTIITYSIISLMFGIPILTFLACIYHMKGSAPCDFKAACCNCNSC